MTFEFHGKEWSVTLDGCGNARLGCPDETACYEPLEDDFGSPVGLAAVARALCSHHDPGCKSGVRDVLFEPVLEALEKAVDEHEV